MDFYPSAKVALAIRLEEFNDQIFKADELPPRNATTLTPAKAVTTLAQLDVVKDPNQPGSFLLLPKGSSVKSAGPGQVQTASTDYRSHTVAGIIPKSANLGFNGVRAADTLAVTLKWEDCPLDPRVIRSCAVDFYLGCVTPQEHAQGISGSTRAYGAREPVNLVQNTYLQDGQSRTNLRFRGWVDEWKVSLDDSGEAVIELQCRDNTQLLIDQKAPQDPRIAIDKPVDEAIAKYLANFPQFAGLSVQFRPTDTKTADKPTLKRLVLDFPLGGLGPPPAKGGGGDGLGVWDYLTDVCGALALNIRVDGDYILIESPISLVNENARPRPEDPYRTRTVDGKIYDVRTFMYGQNVSNMDFNRKYNAHAPGNIEVRAKIPGQKQIVVARFPTKGVRVISANPGDGKADSKWKVIPIEYPKLDQKALNAIAKSQYYMRNRTELECTFKTRDLTSFGGDPLDTDILDARPGDAVQLVIDHAAYGTVAEIDGSLSAFSESNQTLEERGFDPEFIKAYARARTAAQFPKKFIIRDLKISWDTEKGVDVDVTAVNFIVARLDTEPPGEVIKK